MMRLSASVIRTVTLSLPSISLASLREIPAGTWILLVPVLVCTTGILLLLAFVVWMSVAETEAGLFTGIYTFRSYADLFTDPIVVSAAINTLQFSLLALVVAGMVGLPLAWLVERTDLRGKSAVWTLLCLGLLIPGFFTAMGWLFLLHPRVGILNNLLMEWFSLAEAPLPITTIAGMGWVQGLALAPVFFLMTAHSFRAMNSTLEEAATVSGASFLQVIRKIVFPLAMPGILAASVYTLTIALGAFDVPAIIGWASRKFTFSTLLYFKTNPIVGVPDYGVPAAFGMFMVFAGLLLSWLYVRLLRKAHQFEVVTGKDYKPRLFQLGYWSYPAWMFIGIYVLLAQIIPILLLLWSALLPYFQPPSVAAVEQLSLENFRNLHWPLIARAFRNTFFVVLSVPTLVLAVSIAFSWIVLRSNIRGRRLFDVVAFIPIAVPGIIFALGAVLAALFIVPKSIPLYGSVLIIILVYTVGWISFGTRVVNSALIQIHPELEEASYASGASNLSAMWSIILPLMKPAILGAWMWLAVLSFRELTKAAILFTPDNVTLSLLIWSLWEGGSFNQASAVAVVLLVALMPLVSVYFLIGRRTESRVASSDK